MYSLVRSQVSTRSRPLPSPSATFSEMVCSFIRADTWASSLAPYFEEFDEIGTGPDARGPALLLLDQQPGRWTARQIFDDPAGAHDWGFSAEIDLAASDEAGVAVVHVTAVNQL